MTKKANNSNSAMEGLTIDLERLCELDRRADTLRPPERGSDFPPGITRFIARTLAFLGWDTAAEWFVATPDTRPFTMKDYLIRIPAALDPSKPGTFVATFQVNKNQTVMFKRFDVEPLNLTAEEFGRVEVALGTKEADLKPSGLEQNIGLTKTQGQVVLLQSEVRANEGIFQVRIFNFDLLSEAKFTLVVEGWIIQR